MARDRDPIEYVRACERHCCCPLGAATRVSGDNPIPAVAAPALGISLRTAADIASHWDSWGAADDEDDEDEDVLADREEAVCLAIAAGLGPKMVAYLFPEEGAKR